MVGINFFCIIIFYGYCCFSVYFLILIYIYYNYNYKLNDYIFGIDGC